MATTAAPAEAGTTAGMGYLTQLGQAAAFSLILTVSAGAILPTTDTDNVVRVLSPGTGWWGGEEPAATAFVNSTAERVANLKEKSGLTWSQLAALFGVSRRAVHHWVEGGNMTATNVSRLDALQMRLSEHLFASPTEAKSWLFGLEPGGRSRYATWVGELASPIASALIGSIDQQLEGAQPAAYIAQELSTVKRERIRLVDE
jgi:transcriptional regulator with XRE-family HTH domain